ncbi:MAG TPA: hypothetical protein VGP16_29825 [Asanoa sp.]|jgi:hypothetical protein|nr:hypothetical protein [Asanoa sp.]
MTPDELIAEALRVAEAGLDNGEQPIGAVVAMGDDILGRAYTQEKALGRAAMTLGVCEVYYALESPSDGGWHPAGAEP